MYKPKNSVVVFSIYSFRSMQQKTAACVSDMTSVFYFLLIYSATCKKWLALLPLPGCSLSAGLWRSCWWRLRNKTASPSAFMNQLNFLMRELKIDASLASLKTNSLLSPHPPLPQRPGRRGPVCSGGRRLGPRRRRGAADPLHAAAVLLLGQRHHHPEGLGRAAAPAAADTGRRGGQPQEPGRAWRPPLHAGDGTQRQPERL